MRNLTFSATIYLVLLTQCSSTEAETPQPVIPDNHQDFGTKVKGIALESPAREEGPETMHEIAELGADAVCLMPYAFSFGGDGVIQYDSRMQWWGERSDGIRQMIYHAREAGLHVLLKPHIWLGHGDYTGHFQLDNAEAQSAWNESYQRYIMDYAQLAEEYQVEGFCIGTELCYQLVDAPEFWAQLIDSVRSVYSGKMTYAANWDCYPDFPYWDRLDFIGIDAYFPIKDIDGKDEINGWSYWKEEMRNLSDSVGLPVLFTEYGYRSVDFALEEPWEMSRKGNKNEAAQSRALQVLYDQVWDEPWMAGGFLWKWHYPSHLGRLDGTRYTVQGKSAEGLVKLEYQE